MGKWEMVRLGDVGNILTGNTPKTNDPKNYISNDICFFKPSDIDEDKVSILNESENHISNYAKEKARIAPVNSVLVTCIGIVGKIGIIKKEGSFNQQINCILPNSDICEPRYLAYAILNIRHHLNHIANAAVVPIINKSQFSDVQIPVPPLDAQEKIADILDHASALIEKRKAQIAKLDLLVKSQFIQMFGSPVANTHKWETGTIRDIVTEAKYGTSNPSIVGGQYPYLRMNNITYSGHLDINDLKYIDMPENEIEKYIVRKGDVLFNRTNSKELVGKTCVFDLDEPMIIAGYIIRVRLNERATPYYLSAVLNSDYGKQTLREMCKAIIGQANINAQELQDIRILIPPVELQYHFTNLVRAIENAKTEMQHGLHRLEVLYKSLMQKCFNATLHVAN